MLINDVCKKSKLTKKAVEYYEKNGLLKPKLAENGYRIYDEGDVLILKEISVLRKLGIQVVDIEAILKSDDKTAALSKCKRSMELMIEKTKMQYQRLDHLISDYNIQREFDDLDKAMENQFSIREKLLQLFPGNYGLYLSIHFGWFLDGKIDSIEKEAAYNQIIQYLDNQDDFEIPAELEGHLLNCFSGLDKPDMEKMDETLFSMLDNVEEYLEQNKDALNDYLKIRTSQEFKASPAYKFQQCLINFQQQSGYYDVLIHNLKILSPSYLEYTENMILANQRFIEKYPHAGELYS